MAKHKKRKSAPTPDPKDSEKNDLPETEKQDIPEVENSDTSDVENKINPKKETKKPEKVLSEEETATYKKKLNKLFWIRIGLAVIAGTAATFIFEPIEGEERRWASIGFMIVLFFITIGIGKGMKMQLPSSDRKKLVTQGIGSYVFLYLFMWIVSYTLVNMSTSGGIPSPLP